MSPKKTVVTGALNYNTGLEISYRRKIRAIVKQMTDDCAEKVLALYGKEKWQVSFAVDELADDETKLLERLRKKYAELFEKFSIPFALGMVKDMLKYSKLSVDKAIGAALPLPSKTPVSANSLMEAAREEYIPQIPKPKPPVKISIAGSSLEIPGTFITDENRNTIIASITENVSLIKSIPQEYFDKVVGAVMRSVSGNLSKGSLREEIKKYGDSTERRAELIAQDQSRKLYSNLNLREFQARGVTKFKWLHHGGSREPRPYHLAKHPAGLNGGIFDIGKPPIIDQRTGQRGYPAQLPYCRCTMAAVIEI